MHPKLLPSKHFCICLCFVFTAFISKAQSDCNDIKTGTFYYCPKNTNDNYLEVRNDKYLVETNLLKGDSSVYEIKWSNDCVYTLKYISGNAEISDAIIEFNKKHKLLFQVNKITKDYYLFTGYIDKTSNQPILTDTMWLNIKTNVAGNELFKQIKSPSEIKKAHFRDTSKYAILYVYRPGKLSNSLGNYLIYFDDNIMCVAKNNSGYIFKILKEGNFKIESRLYKQEASTNLDIKFGNTYYVKSSIPWGIHGSGNFKLKMEVMKPEDGETNFMMLTCNKI
ncbi:MAG: hypothetical protein JO072_10695 [Parafilimonas sp.]|nr:hypothetical protein [Parafilimonas sp.]